MPVVAGQAGHGDTPKYEWPIGIPVLPPFRSAFNAAKVRFRPHCGYPEATADSPE